MNTLEEKKPAEDDAHERLQTEEGKAAAAMALTVFNPGLVPQVSLAYSIMQTIDGAMQI